MVELLIGLFVGFIAGGVLMVSDYKGKVKKGYLPYIGKDGTLLWQETPNNASTGLAPLSKVLSVPRVRKNLSGGARR